MCIRDRGIDRNIYPDGENVNDTYHVEFKAMGVLLKVASERIKTTQSRRIVPAVNEKIRAGLNSMGSSKKVIDPTVERQISLEDDE